MARFYEKNAHAENMFSLLTIISLQHNQLVVIHRKKIDWWRIFEKSFNFFYVKDNRVKVLLQIFPLCQFGSNDKKSSKKKKLTENKNNEP